MGNLNEKSREKPASQLLRSVEPVGPHRLKFEQGFRRKLNRACEHPRPSPKTAKSKLGNQFRPKKVPRFQKTAPEGEKLDEIKAEMRFCVAQT